MNKSIRSKQICFMTLILSTFITRTTGIDDGRGLGVARVIVPSEQEQEQEQLI